MNLGEYLEKLVALANEHGNDIEVVDAEDNPVSDPEFVEGAIVVADKG